MLLLSRRVCDQLATLGLLLVCAAYAAMLAVSLQARMAAWPPALGCFSLVWEVAQLTGGLQPRSVPPPRRTWAHRASVALAALLNAGLLALFVAFGEADDAFQWLPTRTRPERLGLLLVYTGLYSQTLRMAQRAHLVRLFKYFRLPMASAQLLALTQLRAYQHVPALWRAAVWGCLLAAQGCGSLKMQFGPPPREVFSLLGLLTPLLGAATLFFCFFFFFAALPPTAPAAPRTRLWLWLLGPGYSTPHHPHSAAATATALATGLTAWLAGWAALLLARLGQFRAASGYVVLATAWLAWLLSEHHVPNYHAAPFGLYALLGPVAAAVLGGALQTLELGRAHGLAPRWTPTAAVVAVQALWALCVLPSGCTYLVAQLLLRTVVQGRADSRAGFRLTLLAGLGLVGALGWTRAVVDWLATACVLVVGAAWLVGTHNHCADGGGGATGSPPPPPPKPPWPFLFLQRLDVLVCSGVLVVADSDRFGLLAALLTAEQLAAAITHCVASRQRWYHQSRDAGWAGPEVDDGGEGGGDSPWVPHHGRGDGAGRRWPTRADADAWLWRGAVLGASTATTVHAATSPAPTAAATAATAAASRGTTVAPPSLVAGLAPGIGPLVLVLTSAGLGLTLLGVWGLWRRRAHFPVKGRGTRALALLGGGLLSSALLWLAVAIGGERFPGALATLWAGASFVGIGAAYGYRAVRLVFNYHVTYQLDCIHQARSRHRAGVATDAQLQHAEERATQSWWLRHRRHFSQTALLRWIGLDLCVAMGLMASAAYLDGWPLLWPGPAHGAGGRGLLLRLSVDVLVGLHVLVAVVCGGQMYRFTNDGFYIKAELLAVAVLALVALGAAIGLALLSPQVRQRYATDLLWHTATLLGLLLVSIYAPVLWSYRQETLGARLAGGAVDLEAFLTRDADGRALFVQFLQAEFSTENVYAWDDIRHLKQLFQTHLYNQQTRLSSPQARPRASAGTSFSTSTSRDGGGGAAIARVSDSAGVHGRSVVGASSSPWAKPRPRSAFQRTADADAADGVLTTTPSASPPRCRLQIRSRSLSPSLRGPSPSQQPPRSRSLTPRASFAAAPPRAGGSGTFSGGQNHHRAAQRLTIRASAVQRGAMVPRSSAPIRSGRALIPTTTTPVPVLRLGLAALVCTYIRDGAPEQVNIDGDTREGIMRAFEQLPSHACELEELEPIFCELDKCTKALLRLMTLDSFARFRSQMHTTLLPAAQVHTTQPSPAATTDLLEASALELSTMTSSATASPKGSPRGSGFFVK